MDECADDRKDAKKRGSEHLKKKKKFNKHGKLKVFSSVPAAHMKCKRLQSNVDRYADESDQDLGVQFDAKSNFTYLSQQPIGVGNRFRFKCDEVVTPISYNKQLFNLDLNLLSLSLECVPLHERTGIPLEYLKEHVNELEKQTITNEVEYRNYLEKNCAPRTKQLQTFSYDFISSDSDGEIECIEKLKLVEIKPSLGEHTLEDSISRPENDGGHTSAITPPFDDQTRKEDEELESWLDTILDS